MRSALNSAGSTNSTSETMRAATRWFVSKPSSTRGSGALDEMVGLAEACMAEYDEDGWCDDDYNPDDMRAVGS